MALFVLGVNGSPHKDGVGSALLTRALDQCVREAKVARVDLADHVTNFCDGEYRSATPEGLGELFKLLELADAVIFSTPVYWFNMSALMKAFIEHMTALENRGFVCEGKVAGLIATCEEDGGQSALSLMAAPLVHMGFLLPPYAMLFYNKNMAEKSEADWQTKDAALIGANVVRLAQQVKGINWGYDGMG